MANYDIRWKIIFCSDTYSNNNNNSTVAYDVGNIAVTVVAVILYLSFH